eukprot:1157410-Pelagomonas_calceolata.AAC.10
MTSAQATCMQPRLRLFLGRTTTKAAFQTGKSGVLFTMIHMSRSGHRIAQVQKPPLFIPCMKSEVVLAWVWIAVLQMQKLESMPDA